MLGWGGGAGGCGLARACAVRGDSGVLVQQLAPRGRRLVSHSCRFTLSVTQGCLAAPAHTPTAAGRGRGAQVGGAFTLDDTH
jgi:hypothetical protein